MLGNILFEKLDQKKSQVTITYRLDSGKIVHKLTLIRDIVKKDGQWFVLTDTGEPIRFEDILGLEEKI